LKVENFVDRHHGMVSSAKVVSLGDGHLVMAPDDEFMKLVREARLRGLLD
jgi:hypothetical protein